MLVLGVVMEESVKFLIIVGQCCFNQNCFQLRGELLVEEIVLKALEG